MNCYICKAEIKDGGSIYLGEPDYLLSCFSEYERVSKIHFCKGCNSTLLMFIESKRNELKQYLISQGILY